MAKALGTTAEEEHRTGLAKLATVRAASFLFIFQNKTSRYVVANKRPSRTFLHRYGTPRSDRVVC